MFLLLGPKHDKSNVIYKGIWICRTLFVRASISRNHIEYLESPWTTGHTLRLSSKRRLGRANKVIRFTREHGICTTLLSMSALISLVVHVELLILHHQTLHVQPWSSGIHS